MTFVVESPARDTAVASECYRVESTGRKGDKVALDAIGRRLTVIVISPARDIAVAS